MTDEELAAIEQRVQAATPGPWATGAGLVQKGELRELVTADHDRVIVAMAYGGFGHPEPDCTLADRKFIAAAREDVPALLAEVRRLRALLPEAYDTGFAASGEGWNNEWPREFNTEQQKRYDTERAAAMLLLGRVATT